MKRQPNPSQYILDFESARGELLGLVRMLCSCDLWLSPGRAEGIVQLLERLILLANDLREADGLITVRAQVVAIAARVDGRATVGERTVRNWRRDAEALGLVATFVRSRAYGGHHWNTFTLDLRRLRQIIRDRGVESPPPVAPYRTPKHARAERATLDEAERYSEPTAERAPRDEAELAICPRSECATLDEDPAPTSEAERATLDEAELTENRRSERATLDEDLDRPPPQDSGGNGRKRPEMISAPRPEMISALTHCQTQAKLINHSLSHSNHSEREPPAASGWDDVASALERLGMCDALGAISRARARGSSAAEVADLVERYRTLKAREPGITVGWLYRWISGQSKPSEPAPREPEVSRRLRGDALSRDELEAATLRRRIVLAGRKAGASEDAIERRLVAAGLDP